MRTILYAGERTLDRDKLLRIIHEGFQGLDIDCCRSIRELDRILRQPFHQVSVAILTAGSKRELQALNLMAPLLNDIRIILVLTNRDKSSLALAIPLNPSFIGYLDTDLTDVVSVLKHIQQKQRR